MKLLLTGLLTLVLNGSVSAQVFTSDPFSTDSPALPKSIVNKKHTESLKVQEIKAAIEKEHKVKCDGGSSVFFQN